MNRRAFTLLELVVAMFMFSLVVGSLYGVVHAALLMRETMYVTLESVLPRDHAAAILRRDLGSCLPASGLFVGALLGEKGEEQSLRRDTLELYTASGIVGDASPWGDVQKVQYSVETLEGESTPSLVRRTTRNLLPSTEVEPEPEKLLDDVDALTITYYDGEEWQDSWDANTLGEMPQAISLVVAFSQADEDENEPVNARPPLELLIPVVVETVDTQQSGATGGSGSSGGSGGGGSR